MAVDHPILVVGCGSIGLRHIRNLRSIGVEAIWAVDPSEERLRQAVDSHGVDGCASLDEALERCPHAVVICTPPHLHLPVATQAVAAGAHVFLEKPIAHTLDGVAEFLADAARRGRIVQLGYNLRFQSGMRRVKQLLDEEAIGKPYVIQAEFGQYLPDWHPSQDYRKGYFVSSETGGGIILDASHEIDYVRWLGGEVRKVYCIAKRLGMLEMATEDTAFIMLSMDNGVLGEIHMDCLQRVYSRRCKVIGELGTLTWELKTGVRCFRTGGRRQDFPVEDDLNEMYVAEMRSFVSHAAVGKGPAVVDGEAGRRVLEVALAAKESARVGCEVPV